MIFLLHCFYYFCKNTNYLVIVIMHGVIAALVNIPSRQQFPQPEIRFISLFQRYAQLIDKIGTALSIPTLRHIGPDAGSTEQDPLRKNLLLLLLCQILIEFENPVTICLRLYQDDILLPIHHTP